MAMTAKNINSPTDFGFRKLFGEGTSKPTLIDLPEEVLNDPQRLKIWRGWYAVMDTAFGEGIKAVAKKLKEKGMELEFIVEASELTQEEIEGL
jgi:hypothetical protein